MKAKVNSPIKRIIIAMLMLVLAQLVSCGRNNTRNQVTSDAIDSRTVLSVSGVNLRVFNEDGIAIINPNVSYRLEVTSEANERQVVVALKTKTQLRVSNLELRFNASNEYPKYIECGSAFSLHKPLIYQGCPQSGLVISSQVIPGVKTCEVSGELLKLRLAKGRHSVRNTSGFNQDPIKDPVITVPKVDIADLNKLSWTLKLRGDGNGNLVFDFADFGVIGAKYNQKRGDKQDSEIADGSNNSIVDFADFGIVGANYNKGIGGVDIYRGNTSVPTELIGRLPLNGKLKGDLALDPAAVTTGTNGFKSYWHKVGGSGRYIKLLLLDVTGIPYSTHNQIIDTLGSSSLGWPMFGKDSTHSHSTTAIGSQTNELKWSFDTTGFIDSSPVICDLGNIYIGSQDNNLYSLKPNGNLNWKYTAGDKVNSTPAVDKNGNLYFGCDDNGFYCLTSNGTLNWKYPTSGKITGSANFDSSGSIYFGSYDSKLYSLSPDGKLKWFFKTDDYITSTPAIGSDGTVYFGSFDKKLYALNPDGTKKWDFTAPFAIESSPAIGVDGTIYFGSFDDNLYALNPDGKQKWMYHTGGDVTSSPAIGADGTIYVGSYDNNLHAINPDGSKKWTYKMGSSVHSSPAIGGDGTIYVGSYDQTMNAIKPDGSKLWQYTATGPVWSSPAIGSDGTIYFGSLDKKVYAINKDNTLYPPTDVEASKGTEKDKIIIKWKAPLKGKVPAKFNIKRKEPLKEFILVKSVAGDVLQWEDVFKTPDLIKYIYVVTSGDDIGGESSNSNEAEGWLLGSVTDQRGDWWTENGNEYNTRKSSSYDSSNSLSTGVQVYDFNASHPGEDITTGGTYNIDGTTYFGTSKGNLLAIDPSTGKEIFFVDPLTGNELPWMNTPTVLPNGNIVGSTGGVGKSDKNVIFQFNSDGQLQGTPFTLDGTLEGGVLPVNDTTFYFGTLATYPNGGTIWKMDTDNKVIDQFSVPGGIVSSPALLPNTTSMVFTSYSETNSIHVFDYSTDTFNNLLNTQVVPGTISGIGTSPIVYEDATPGSWIFTNSEDGKLYKFDIPYTTTVNVSNAMSGPSGLLLNPTGNVFAFNLPTSEMISVDRDLKDVPNFPKMLPAGCFYRDAFLDNNGRLVIWIYDMSNDETVIDIYSKDGSTVELPITFKGEANSVTPSALKGGKLLVVKKDNTFHYY